MSEPVLTELGQRYKRNILLISTVGCLLVWVDGVDTSTLTVFGLKVGNNVWFVGIGLFLYQWLVYLVQLHIGWNNWMVELEDFNNSILFLFGKEQRSEENKVHGPPYIKLSVENGIFRHHEYYKDNEGKLVNENWYRNIKISTVRATRGQFIQFVFVDILIPIAASVLLYVALTTQPWGNKLEIDLEPTTKIVN